MKTILLKGQLRETLGTTDSRLIREEGLVPCVLYGGKDHLHFAVHAGDFKNLVYTPNTYAVKLEIGDKSYRAILQDIQFHPVNDQILHVDFLEVFEDKPVSLSIPVKLTGNSVGVRAGGRLLLKLKKIKVKGLLSSIPDYIEVDIENLDIGKSVKVAELKPEGIEILDAANNAVVSITATRATREASAAAGK